MRKKLLKIIAAAASLSMLSVCSLPAATAYAVNDYGVSVLYADYGKQKLTGNKRYFYDELGKAIDDIAKGRRTNTVVEIKVSAAALTGTMAEQASDMLAAYNYLLADKPQSIYWIDKANFAPGVSSDGRESTFTIPIPVASEYAAGANETAPAKIAEANTALQYAQTIVDENRSLPNDYAKALAYKNAICGLVSYNRDAVLHPDTAESSVWGLIYVFDNDASTNVVCEGYAKAFQYLCDLGGVECYTVTGEMSSGESSEGHMWNIVRLRGVSYLVDVTNCDSLSIGAPELLFLKGAETSTSASCAFTCNGQSVVYTYDSDTMDMYPAEIRTVSTEDFDPLMTDIGGDESEGNESEGDESEGNESGGNESGGNESEGNESGGNESGGNESGGNGSGGNESGEGSESGGNESEGNNPEEKSDAEKVADAKKLIEGLSPDSAFNWIPANKFDERNGKDRIVSRIQSFIVSTGAAVSYISHTVDENNKTAAFTFELSAGDERDTANVIFMLGASENDEPAPAPVSAPVVYGVSFIGDYSGSGVVVTGARTAGSQMTVTAPVGYGAVVRSGNNIIANVTDGTATFTMPAGNITVSVSSYLGALTTGYKNAYIYSYDSDMNPIATNSVRGGMQSSEGEITVKLGAKYAGRTVTLYSGRKSTSAKIDEAVLDSRGQATFAVKSGKNYTLVVE